MNWFRRLALPGIAALAVVAPGAAQGAVGWVEHTDYGCDYFVVDAWSSYAVLEWFGGAFPFEGQRVVGRFESYGFKTVRIGPRRTRVWVEDFWLDRDQAYEVMYENC